MVWSAKLKMFTWIFAEKCPHATELVPLLSCTPSAGETKRIMSEVDPRSLVSQARDEKNKILK